MLTRRDLVEPALADDTRVGALVHRAPVVVHPDHSLRDAADHMVTANVGRVVVVTRAQPRVPIGILTRGDLLAAHARRLDARHRR